MKEIISIIDNFFDVIYEKLNNIKYGLIIDNVQYMDSAFIYFLNKFIRYAKNSNRVNKTVLICVFNTDYLRDKSDAFDLLSNFKNYSNNDFLPILSFKIDGFQEIHQGLVFLKELLGVKSNSMDQIFEKILNKTSLNPFFIDQAIQFMKDKNIIAYENNNFHIENIEAFYITIDELPERASDLIEKRWNYYLNINENIEKDCIILISLISFFGTLGRDLLSIINLDASLINSLTKHNFIKMIHINNILFVEFYHDLFEKFFIKKYLTLLEHAIEYVLKNKDLYNYTKYSYLAQYNLCKMYEFQNRVIELTKEQFDKTVMCFLKTTIGFKLQGDYYRYFLKFLLQNIVHINEDHEKFEHFIKICAVIRDSLGSAAAEQAYNSIYKSIHIELNFNNTNYKSYVSFIIKYAELLFHSGKSEKSIQLLNDLEKQVNNEIIDIDKDVCMAKIYNRLHVFHRSFDDKRHDQLQQSYWQKSFLLSQKLNNPLLLYLNYSDYGYVNYCDIKYKNKILEFWYKACTTFENNNVGEKTLNYYRKKVQIALIEHHITKALEFIEIGLDYIENGTYAYEKLYFKTYFYIAKIITLLIENKNENYASIGRLLIIAEEHEMLINNGRLYIISHLKAKYFYNLKEYTSSYQQFKNSYNYLITRNKKNKCCHIQILLEDMTNLLRKCEYKFKETDFDFIQDETTKNFFWDLVKMDIEDFTKYYEGYQAKSIICSSDEKINYPII